MRRPAVAASASILLLALIGCAATDHDRRDNANQKSAAHGQPDPRAPGWWAVLNDPVLVDVLERSHKNNVNPREAMARLREARARRGVNRMDRFPIISTEEATSTEDSDGTSTSPINELYSAAYDASWEMDVFGGPRSVVGATEAELNQRVDDMGDVLVTLFAEVALNYIEVRSFQTRLSLANEHIVSQGETYVVTRWRKHADVSRKRDLEQARVDLDETRAQIPGLEAGLAEARNRLAVLLAESPDELAQELAAGRGVPSARVGVAVGVPAETLRQRPDVRRAERDLSEQLATSASARPAAFSLSGSIGLDAMSPAVRSSLSKRNANLTPFDADSVGKNIKVQTQTQGQARTDYEVAVITALKEVDDVLVAYTKGEARREALERTVESAKSAAELANSRYLSDRASLESMLKAQRTLLSLQDQLATSEGEVASNLIRLYKALGGGWAPLDPAAVTPAGRKKGPTRQSNAAAVKP